MNFFLEIIINAVALAIAAYVMPNIFVRSIGAAFTVALVFGLLNPGVGWVMHKIQEITQWDIPVLVGFGFVLRVIIGAILIKIIDHFLKGLQIKGFVTALVLTLWMASVGTLLAWAFN